MTRRKSSPCYSSVTPELRALRKGRSQAERQRFASGLTVRKQLDYALVQTPDQQDGAGLKQHDQVSQFQGSSGQNMQYLFRLTEPCP